MGHHWTTSLGKNRLCPSRAHQTVLTPNARSVQSVATITRNERVHVADQAVSLRRVLETTNELGSVHFCQLAVLLKK